MLAESLVSILVTSGQEILIPTRLSYEDTDPFAVSLELELPDETICWQLSRDLLLAGTKVNNWVGEGDVLLRRRDDQYLSVHLRSPSGQVTLLLPGETVSDFCHATADWVRLGRENNKDIVGNELDDLLEYLTC